MDKPNIGQINTPYGTILQEHELQVSNLLIKTGNNVDFIPVGLLPTADLRFMNLEWELKSPTGSGRRTIEKNLRKALRQSTNVMLDLSRIAIAEDKCLLYLQNHIKNFRELKRLIIITKDQKILKLSPKTACIKEIPVLK